MEQFIKQYGMVVCYALVGIILMGTIYGVFRAKWAQSGAAADSKKTEYTLQAKKKEKPILLVEDKKVVTGAAIDLNHFATAKEWGQEGKDLTDKVKWETIDGNLLVKDGIVNTAMTGKLRVKFYVASENGTKKQKNITILVDIGKG